MENKLLNKFNTNNKTPTKSINVNYSNRESYDNYIYATHIKNPQKILDL
jgi:hypothetical protein